MPKIKAYIIEDDIENIELLKLFIKKCRNDIEIIGEASNTAQFNDLLLLNKADIIFLDIELEDQKTSLDVLNNFYNIEAEIIITSSSEKYAIKAVNEREISSYILKPINVLSLKKAIDRAAEKIKQKIKFPTFIYDENLVENFIDEAGNEKIEIIDIQTIMYLEADGKYTKFHLSNDSPKIVSKLISSYLEILPKNNFFKIHPKYIIPFSKSIIISTMDGYFCLLNNGETLPTDKMYLEEYHKFLI
jgi:two-component system LytT family response regulator